MPRCFARHMRRAFVTGHGGRHGERFLLIGLRLAEPAASDRDTFPFTIPALKGLREMSLPGPVTFFAGGNGSGKSTLLEAIALANDLPTVGSKETGLDASLTNQRKLARSLKGVWDRKMHRGFFLRAEDFFGFIGRLESVKAEMAARLEEIEREYQGRSELAKRLAKGPVAATLASIESRYGENLDANSHGETFLHVFRERFVPGGLYLIDEPEAALSPQSQLGFVSMMADVVSEGGQFIIATHSPVLMAVPGATIYNFDESPLREVAYDGLEGVQLLKTFLQAPERYMRHLWREPGREPGDSAR